MAFVKLVLSLRHGKLLVLELTEREREREIQSAQNANTQRYGEERTLSDSDRRGVEGTGLIPSDRSRCSGDFSSSGAGRAGGTRLINQ